jgi:hypothetical protein
VTAEPRGRPGGGRAGHDASTAVPRRRSGDRRAGHAA